MRKNCCVIQWIGGSLRFLARCGRFLLSLEVNGSYSLVGIHVVRNVSLIRVLGRMRAMEASFGCCFYVLALNCCKSIIFISDASVVEIGNVFSLLSKF